MMDDVLTIWTIYKHPRDYPGKWVLRGFDIGADGNKPHSGCVVTDSLEAVRAAMPIGLVRMSANPLDDQVIYEVWM